MAALSPTLEPSAHASFGELNIDPRLVGVLSDQGITRPFPIQSATINDALEGRDTLGRGRTGSGKTLAFVLPLLTTLADSGAARRRKHPRALILTPTRELANQIADVLAPLAKVLGMRHTVVYGGVSYTRQIAALRDGVDVVVACPGRLVDLLNSNHIELSDVEVTVLDEADHMVDLGFLTDVRTILDLTPVETQRLLFSATLDTAVRTLISDYLVDPVVHEVDDEAGEDEHTEHHVLHVSQDERLSVITDLCAAPGKSVVFTRTKRGAERLAAQLVKAGVPSVELHGNLSQSVRARNLAAFSSGRVATLVATDIAARGIHVDAVALVIHADPPAEHRSFLHRSGRTARAGASGKVVTLMTDQQRRAVRRLTKDAGISATTTRVSPTDPFLQTLAPGDREFGSMPDISRDTNRPRPGGSRPGGARPGGSRRARPRPDRSRPNDSRSDRSRSGDSRSDRSRSDESRSDRSRPDDSRPGRGPRAGGPTSRNRRGPGPRAGSRSDSDARSDFRPESRRGGTGRPGQRSRSTTGGRDGASSGQPRGTDRRDPSRRPKLSQRQRPR